MSIIYDADGFAHRAAISNYDRNGYLQPAFDFSKGHVTEDFIDASVVCVGSLLHQDIANEVLF